MTESPSPGRWVFDSNVLVSSLLRPEGAPGRALALAVTQSAKLLMTVPTLAELNEVLARPKFDRYVSRATRREFVANLMPLVEIAPPSAPIRACRDPRDDKFLEPAVHGNADALITGDEDLLALHPFHGVPIVAPQDFLALHAPGLPSPD